MKFTRHAILLLLVGSSAIACAATTSDSDGPEGDGDGDGDGTTGTGGSGPGAGGSGPGAGGSGPGAGGSGPGAGGSGTVGCITLVPSSDLNADYWYAGDSEAGDVVVATGNNGLTDSTGIPGLDEWGGPSGWASVSYALAPDGGCATGATSIKVTVNATVAGDYRVSLATTASNPSSNHYGETKTLTPGATVYTLPTNGTGLGLSWEDAAAPAFDAAHLLQVVIQPRSGDAAGLAPYGFTVDAIVIE